jgi:hypothetical protein
MMDAVSGEDRAALSAINVFSLLLACWIDLALMCCKAGTISTR